MTDDEIRKMVLELEVEVVELKRIAWNKDYSNSLELDKQMEYSHAQFARYRRMFAERGRGCAIMAELVSEVRRTAWAKVIRENEKMQEQKDENESNPRADFGFSVKGWRRRGNFFHAIEPKFVGAFPSDARERSGKDTIILAPGNRIKMWLEYSMDGRSLARLHHTDISEGETLVPLDDVVCDSVVERANGLHEAYLDADTWYRVLRNTAGEDEADDSQLAPHRRLHRGGVFRRREGPQRLLGWSFRRPAAVDGGRR